MIIVGQEVREELKGVRFADPDPSRLPLTPACSRREREKDTRVAAQMEATGSAGAAELHLVTGEAVVDAAALDHLVVRALLDDTAVFHDVDAIAIDHGAEPVADDDDRALTFEAAKRLGDHLLVVGIEALVGSSRTRIGASVARARAMPMRWRWPPERF